MQTLLAPHTTARSKQALHRHLTPPNPSFDQHDPLSDGHGPPTLLALPRRPRTCTTVRPRRSFATSVWCVSARPSSQGRPALLMDVHLAAPVPPSWPEISTWSAWPAAWHSVAQSAGQQAQRHGRGIE